MKLAGRFDDRSTINGKKTGGAIDLRPEDGLEIKLPRQAAFREHLLGQAEIGFVLMDRPFPFRTVCCDTNPTIHLQGLTPASRRQTEPAG